MALIKCPIWHLQAGLALLLGSFATPQAYAGDTWSHMAPHQCDGMVTTAPCWVSVNPGVYFVEPIAGDSSFALSVSRDDAGGVAVYLLNTENCKSVADNRAIGRVGTYVVNSISMEFFGACVNGVEMARPMEKADQDALLSQITNQRYLVIDMGAAGKLTYDVKQFPSLRNRITQSL